jgi:hypothetical protein
MYILAYPFMCNQKSNLEYVFYHKEKRPWLSHGLLPKQSLKAIIVCNYFTASLSALPGLKAGTLLAPISISSPV